MRQEKSRRLINAHVYMDKNILHTHTRFQRPWTQGCASSSSSNMLTTCTLGIQDQQMLRYLGRPVFLSWSTIHLSLSDSRRSRTRTGTDCQNRRLRSGLENSMRHRDARLPFLHAIHRIREGPSGGRAANAEKYLRRSFATSVRTRMTRVIHIGAATGVLSRNGKNF